MHAAALAALPFNIPVAHIHGGELTFGAIDDALRHSMTKLSHLHFVSTKEYARRVAQLGEEKWRITVSGAPSLDNFKTIKLLDKPALEKKLKIRLTPPPLLVTFHPVTLEYTSAAWQAGELLAAIKASGRPVIFTLPNSDTGGRVIRAMIEKHVKQNDFATICDNLGTQNYFSLMKIASAMVGNSSSGIIEAPSLKLPVVNIGSRQGGRVRAKNVIDVDCRREEILAGIRCAVSDKFRSGLRGMVNPYGDGHAAERIVRRLKSAILNDRLIRKIFQDIKV
jgi:UDP-hydrolysing UDP-N-acetyl-D-glucosamine 2-epimerase